MIDLLGIVSSVVLSAVFVVTPTGPYRTITEALAAAQPGDTIEVHGGVYPGGIVVDRSVTLVGIGSPVIDGGGKGTVITLAAPDVTLRGFVVRGSGQDFNSNDAGIEVQAPRVAVEDNQLEAVLTGISLDNAQGASIRNNRITGLNLPTPDRGDGLRLWYSSGTLIEGNHIEATRDCVIWYSNDVRIINNQIEDGRYGLHFMFNDRAVVTGNVLRGNSVAAYLMYSQGVTLTGNLLAASRGPSGFGLGLKDVDALAAQANWLVDNRVGIWIDNSPRSLDVENRLTRNVFAYNDIGLSMQPAVQRNTFTENSFQDNLQQVSVLGGGTLSGNDWSEDGRGNYWSDYRGFDAGGDGIGDTPYRVEALFAELLDRRPEFRLFQFGLAAQAIEFGSQAFPVLRPAPKLTDNAPLQKQPEVPPPPGSGPVDPRAGLGLAVGLLFFSGSVAGLTRLQPSSRSAGASLPVTPAVLTIERLTKRFGRITAVQDLDLVVSPGEAVALWGPNGVGKSTTLKCILGLLSASGRITVAGYDHRRQGKAVRHAIGYVAQDTALHDDLTVDETATFYSRLRHIDLARLTALLTSLDLHEHRTKRVGALSGGLRQRLALALALAGDPPLLLLDEPMSGLDAAVREQVLQLLIEQRERGSAILFSSHRLPDVEALADRVVVLDRGRCVLECPPAGLAQHLAIRQNLRLTIDAAQRLDALAVLSQAGLVATTRRGFVQVEVAPNEKIRPIRVLEAAGITVHDFSIEDAVNEPRPGEEQ